MNYNILTPRYNSNGTFIRQIRSFVCRKGRISKSQVLSIQRYWSIFGVYFEPKKIDMSSIFPHLSPIVLEIGFGSGISLVNMAINSPHKNFLGIEVYKSGIGSCLNHCVSAKVNNIKIICHDAVEVIEKMIRNHTLYTIQIFFPDPWNKKKHNKRRLLNYNFLKILIEKISIGGVLHIMTDSESYAIDILNSMHNIKKNIKIFRHKTMFHPSFISPITRFQERGVRLGNKIFDLIFQIL